MSWLLGGGLGEENTEDLDMRELDSAQSQMEQEQAIKQIILSRLRRTTIVQAPQQEAVAYRLAEILVAARQLYTDVLPSFFEQSAEAGAPSNGAAPHVAEVSDEADDRIFEAFGEVRMNLLHLRDLVEDFEETFLESLSGRLQRQQGEGPDDESEDGDDDDA